MAITKHQYTCAKGLEQKLQDLDRNIEKVKRAQYIVLGEYNSTNDETLLKGSITDDCKVVAIAILEKTKEDTIIKLNNIVEWQK